MLTRSRKNEERKMLKKDLKTGMVVELRNGDKYLVMLNPETEGRELISFESGWMPLSKWFDNLIFYNSDNDWDIVKVYSFGDYICRLFDDNYDTESLLMLIWERNEESIEMTIPEIEKKLGIKNLKIVKEGE
jgi:hypothetical protein